MPKNALPTSSDITSLLAALPVPITLPGGFDVDSEVAFVVESWSERTNYQPFFQTSNTPVTMYFDPPGADRSGYSRGASTNLRLRNGLISITSLAVGVVVADSDAGTTLIKGKDYWLAPSNAQSDSNRVKPWTEVEFSLPQRGLPQSIAISGVWGYCNATTGIPDDAWAAIRDMAAARCLESLAQFLALAPQSWHRGEVGEAYDAKMLREVIDFLNARAERVIYRYRLF